MLWSGCGELCPQSDVPCSRSRRAFPADWRATPRNLGTRRLSLAQCVLAGIPPLGGLSGQSEEGSGVPSERWSRSSNLWAARPNRPSALPCWNETLHPISVAPICSFPDALTVTGSLGDTPWTTVAELTRGLPAPVFRQHPIRLSAIDFLVLPLDGGAMMH